jgi:hypothetical protein
LTRNARTIALELISVAAANASRVWRSGGVKTGRGASHTRQEVRSHVFGVRMMDDSARSAGVELTGGPVHNDFAFIVLTVVFFVAAGLLTIACDRIIGADPVEEPLEDETTPEQLAA